MQLFKSIPGLIRHVKALKSTGMRIGFVPTMGALHQGHISLVERSIGENNATICSIFVNPAQFNNKRDYYAYPHTDEQDISKLEKAGCQALFMPSVEEMYPPAMDTSGTGMDASMAAPEKNREENFDFGNLDKTLEGKYRPGHFRGVALVVSKLFDITRPHKAYFGEKDYQQLLIIRELVKLKRFPVEIAGCPTVREPDGLAMSSRNLLLTEEERKTAPLLFNTLTEAKRKISSVNVKTLKKWVTAKISADPRFTVEYFEIADSATLVPVVDLTSPVPCRGFVSVYLGKVRLIDNISFVP